MNFFQASLRQSMIQRLAANEQDKEVWRKAANEIANLIHDDTMLTLENTSAVMSHPLLLQESNAYA